MCSPARLSAALCSQPLAGGAVQDRPGTGFSRPRVCSMRTQCAGRPFAHCVHRSSRSLREALPRMWAACSACAQAGQFLNRSFGSSQKGERPDPGGAWMRWVAAGCGVSGPDLGRPASWSSPCGCLLTRRVLVVTLGNFSRPGRRGRHLAWVYFRPVGRER